MDKDLRSIQETRDLVNKARQAQQALAQMDAREIDEIVRAMAERAERHAARLAALAVAETGFGREEDKTIKNLFASRMVYDSIKDVKTTGIVKEDAQKRIVEVAVPVGVIAGLIPSTNPTSTAIFKALISVKAGNAIVMSPHPSAVGCIVETVKLLSDAALSAGAPEGIVSTQTLPTLEGSSELMKRVDLILATGGSAMVRAAHSSGTPAIGVGPGNVPAFIERTADVPAAVRRILASKTFDNGTICASEQSIVTERCIEEQVKRELVRQGAHFVSGEDEARLSRLIQRPGGSLNPKIVGKTALQIAEMAGVSVPAHTRAIVCEQQGVGAEYPFSMEKLSPLLAFYTEEDWHSACERCIELLNFAGLGHSLCIHSLSESVIREFALRKPVSRVLVNTCGSQGAIGATTGLWPSLTLGCGTVGGSATTDNISVHHLFHIRRCAYGLIEPEALALEGGGPEAKAPPDEEEIVSRVVHAVMQALKEQTVI